ncbi:MAG: glycosyltransferase family 39 protein [Actinomycetota bacterium]
MSTRASAALGVRFRSLVVINGRWTLAILALIVVCGLVLRVDRATHPHADAGDDARAYFSLAKSLYEDGSYGGPTFRDADDWSPGTPLLAAGVYYVTGGVRDNAARLLIALMGAAAIVVAYLLGRRISCRPAGLMAAAGVAFYPPFVHTTGALLSEPPALLTLPAAVLAFLWAAEQERPWAWLLPGLLFGLTALFRPEYLFVALVFIALALYRVWRERGPRPGTAAAGLMLAAFLVCIVPWTIRNLVVLDRFVPLSTGSGKALYVGSYLPADGDYQRVKATLVERYQGRVLEPGSEALERVDPVPLFDRVAARYPDLERDQALGKIGRANLEEYLTDQPLDYLAMLARKVGGMWGTGVGPAMDSTVGRIAQRALLLLALCGFGVFVWRRRWWELVAFAVPIGVITAIGAITLASNRRNEILMTLVIPLAATALARAGAIVRRRLRERHDGRVPAAGPASA